MWPIREKYLVRGKIQGYDLASGAGAFPGIAARVTARPILWEHVVNLRLGKRIIGDLNRFISGIKSQKPIRQSAVRRMIVKGKFVYVHDSFTAPIGRKL